MKASSAGLVRVGVVGCGVIAYWVHLRLLQKLSGAKLVVASDPDRDARARAGKIARVPIVQDSAAIFSDDQVDAVVICSPTHLHADLAVAACSAGKHVFLEKPIATNATDARRVVAAAASAGVSAMIGFNRRRHPMYEQARDLIAAGGIGPVRAVHTAFCEPMKLEEMSPWRRSRESGGGVLLDLASHHIDLLRWFLDDEVESADARISSVLSEHDTASVTLEMSKGAVAQSSYSFRTARADFMEFIGETGTLRIDRHEPRFTLKVARRFGYGTRTLRVVPSASSAAWRVRRLVQPSVEPSYRNSLAAFVDSIRGGPGQVATFADGARNIDVIAAAEASADARAPVRVVDA